MSQEPMASLRMSDFPGMVTRIDVRDLPDGAAEEQLNLRSERIGELTMRPGWRVVNFESDP